MALLSLGNIGYCGDKEEMCFKEMTEIIEYHQEHRNLTQLAYQSAWQFLIFRLNSGKNKNEVIVNELRFGEEATRELEELSKYVDWKDKKEGKGGKEEKELLVIGRWLYVIFYFFDSCNLWNEELAGLVGSLVSVFRASRDNHRETSNQCIYAFKTAAERKCGRVDDLLKGGAVDAILEEIRRPTLDDEMICDCLIIFVALSSRLKEEDDKTEKVERRAAKRKMFDKMEEEGYEDIIISFHEVVGFLNTKYLYVLLFGISDYFVNI
ncbi:uncharacterized protein MONOS_10959 [Monocercomonoides exilis]|uniref:uncharacterized protein n=1 Tax=Monocercomonoides exilis TaxID=2049356 RepID=UPI00355A1A49|nr:hypothetical protein MONOS_10959 [Monocercomonoides exilis]|eukprot:MONOS_10959.1-p1 / transcript=MONOS_10959.1 / gene=MONOS_10959 / organism=Monocercomonoides_exilis_PA203 / gene_product=unspecified product / transcript_product=unspecified product / location=Mono_scaffold00522:5693-6567(+) / protein_length=266 / sequence_SO=supercontig / SO=protein_coding / is_pseudo=false